MKIKTEIDLSLSAKAVYRDGKILLSVSGAMPYAGGRIANATIEGGSEKTTTLFSEAFEALLAEQQEQIIKLTQAAQAETMTVAARMGEL